MIEEKKEKLNTGKENVKTDDQQDEKSKLKSKKRFLKKKVRKNVPNAIAHVCATFNNTVINITDINGNTLSWSSSGVKGFKGSRK